MIANPVSGWISGADNWDAWIGSYPYQWYPVVVIASPVSGWMSGASVSDLEDTWAA